MLKFKNGTKSQENRKIKRKMKYLPKKFKEKENYKEIKIGALERA